MKQKPFHVIRSAGVEFTDEEWGAYCQAIRREERDPIITTFGKYKFNDCDICINPDRETIAATGGAYGYSVELKLAYCGNCLWSFGLSYNLGTCGGGFGVSWADLHGDENSWRNGYQSEQECKVAGWKKALEYIGHHEHNSRTSPAEKLREMIEDEIKRLTRPQVVQLELFSF